MSDKRIFQHTLLLLGGNQGDVIANGQWVAERLKDEYSIIQTSSWYASPAWGFEGPGFLNRILALEKVENVEQLLMRCLSLELELGRVRASDGNYSNRPMDIDILYHGNAVYQSEKLSVPHPKIQERRFTLVPLNEHWSDFVHPVFNKTQEELLNDCQDEAEVKLISVDEE